MFKEFLERINTFFAKFLFSSKERIDLYRSLTMLLENQVRLNEALKQLYKVYSDNDKNPNVPVALVIKNCLDAMNQGTAFTVALSNWLPSEEAMLLQAGESSGKLADAFTEAEKIISAKRQIIGSIAGAVSYPVVLFGLTGFLLHMVATDLVPKLEKVVDPKKWTGAAKLLYSISTFVNTYGLTFVLSVIALVILIMTTLGRFRGKIRVFFDKFPPWSIYRMVQGATFLMNVAALIKSGVQLNMALEQLAQSANPWLKQRIKAALNEIALGKNLGEALNETGYHFPDKKANQFLAIIAQYSGIDEAMSEFGNRWLQETVSRIQAVSQLLLMGGIACVGVTMLIVIAGAGGLQDAIQASAG